MIKQSLIAALVAAGVLSATSASADIYAFTDSDGTVHLSNVPNDKRFSVYLKTPKERAPINVGDLRSAAPRIYGNLGNKVRYDGIVDSAARQYQIDANLLHAVISAESGYNPNAISPKGAFGLMQLMPDTARRYGVTNRLDPVQNIAGGARYLRDLLQMFNNDTKLAVAAYNAGENAVIRFGNRIPPYRETIQYVPKVLGYYQKYQGMM